ncbi:MAG: type III secretion system export apparatus subunit SctS [Deltaproteobacteria bacterium]|nr:type III secretion system export apparatus subunit SctS [Deltaproteobacteria bacterium]
MSVQDFIVQITNEAILITILVSMPAILLSLLIGVAVAIFSATTQIQEQSLSFVPKMIAVFGVIAITGPWIGATMMRFAERCLGGFVEVMR